jgi:hypothetical protein
MDFSGSPKKKMSTSFTVYEDNDAGHGEPVSECGVRHTLRQRQFINAFAARPQPQLKSHTFDHFKVCKLTSNTKHHTGELRSCLFGANYPITDALQKMEKENNGPVNELVTLLTKQQEALSRKKQQPDEHSNEDGSSSPTDPFANTPPTESVSNSEGCPDPAQFLRLQKELEFARERMAEMDLELTQSRITRHTVEEAIGSPFPAAQHLAFNIGSGVANTPHGRATPFRPGVQIAHSPGAGLWIDTGVPAGGDVYTAPQYVDSHLTLKIYH